MYIDIRYLHTVVITAVQLHRPFNRTLGAPEQKWRIIGDGSNDNRMNDPVIFGYQLSGPRRNYLKNKNTLRVL